MNRQRRKRERSPSPTAYRSYSRQSERRCCAWDGRGHLSHQSYGYVTGSRRRLDYEDLYYRRERTAHRSPDRREHRRRQYDDEKSPPHRADTARSTRTSKSPTPPTYSPITPTLTQRTQPEYASPYLLNDLSGRHRRRKSRRSQSMTPRSPSPHQLKLEVRCKKETPEERKRPDHKLPYRMPEKYALPGLGYEVAAHPPQASAFFGYDCRKTLPLFPVSAASQQASVEKTETNANSYETTVEQQPRDPRLRHSESQPNEKFRPLPETTPANIDNERKVVRLERQMVPRSDFEVTELVVHRYAKDPRCDRRRAVPGNHFLMDRLKGYFPTTIKRELMEPRNGEQGPNRAMAIVPQHQITQGAAAAGADDENKMTFNAFALYVPFGIPGDLTREEFFKRYPMGVTNNIK